MKKLVLVTGAGRGIGQAMALKLADAGYFVHGCARSKSELAHTRKLSGDRVQTTSLDVSEPDSLMAWIEKSCADKDATPWGLVTAAGVFGPIGPFTDLFRGKVWDEWRKAMEINLYGTAIAAGCFARLLLERRSLGRIVLLSGGGATQPMANFTSYCATKSAVVRFGETLALELKGTGITVNSVAPGSVNTRLLDDVINAGPDKAGRAFYDRTKAQKEKGDGDPGRAAELVEYLMSDASASITGKLISAIWDPWESFERPGVLSREDLYTLRRVVPDEKKK